NLPAAVLAQKAQMAAHLLAEERPRLPPPARAPNVDDLRPRKEERPPARRLRAVAPVRLLAEEEELLVERSDLVVRRAAQQKARRLREVDLARLVVPEGRAGERIERPRAGAELRQEEVFGREPPGGRKSPNRRLKRAVGIQQPGADEGGALLLLRERDHPLRGVVYEPGVRVQHDHERRRRLPQPAVPAGGEAAVLL